MNKARALTFVLLTLGLGLVLFSSTPGQSTAQESELAYDLLILGKPFDMSSEDFDYISGFSMFHLDTTTWEVTPLDVEWRPLGNGALSPDEQFWACIIRSSCA